MEQGSKAQNARVTALTAEQVVQAQVDAYNRHDIEAFLNTYAPEVEIYDHPDKLRLSGLEQMRKSYTAFFSKHPTVTAIITNRIVQGQYVIDHEAVTGLPEEQLDFGHYEGVVEGRACTGKL
jgi:uncharacterized protein (TIGR02246 family)